MLNKVSIQPMVPVMSISMQLYETFVNLPDVVPLDEHSIDLQSYRLQIDLMIDSMLMLMEVNCLNNWYVFSMDLHVHS